MVKIEIKNILNVPQIIKIPELVSSICSKISLCTWYSFGTTSLLLIGTNIYMLNADESWRKFEMSSQIG